MKDPKKKELAEIVDYLRSYLGPDGIVKGGEIATAEFATAVSRAIILLAEKGNKGESSGAEDEGEFSDVGATITDVTTFSTKSPGPIS